MTLGLLYTTETDARLGESELLLTPLCNVCEYITRKFGTNESVLPWYCKCELFQHKPVRPKQKLITQQCNCSNFRIVVLKKTRHRIERCDCD